MDKKIRVVQVGVTHEHAAGKLRALRNLPELYEIVGVVDDRQTAVTPHRGGFDPAAFGLRVLTFDEALAEPELDAVTIETPNNELVAAAMPFARRGIAMHMDKPPGETMAEFQELLNVCAAGAVPFQMGFMFRSNPAFHFCIEAIRGGLLGEVFEIVADMNHNYGGEAYQEYIGKFPGGIMLNLGCHLIDFVVSALGRPERVSPFLRSVAGYPDDTHNLCAAILEYPHCLVHLRASSKAVGGVDGRFMKIGGTNGSIFFSPLERFDGKGVEVRLRLEHGAGTFPAGSHILTFAPQMDRYVPQLEELARMIRKECRSPFSYEHDALVHAVTLAAAGCTAWRA